MPAKRRRHDPAFRAEITRRIRAKVKELQKEKKGFSEAAAARLLGVTPQAFNRYMRGLATPNAHTLARACTVWGLRFSYKGREFAGDAFDAPEEKQDVQKPVQLTLFAEPQEIQNRNLKLRVEAGKSASLNVSLEIKFAS
jgi:transcriptional regulator with XRE-family HTH domain